MADRILRLCFDLPGGVVVRTSVITPTHVADLFGGFTTKIHEAKSNRPSRLELDVPEDELDKVLAALHAARR